MSELRPVHYKIHLEPDLETFRFLAWTEMLLESEDPTEEISLDAVGLAVWSCKAAEGDALKDCPFTLDPGQEELKVFLPERMQGRIRLKIDYMGHINDGMSGFYRTSYRVGELTRHAAVTQFEESDARRAFPCLDHPRMKATFDLEMVIDERLTALSNGPVTEEMRIGGGKKLVRFKRTPRMSTYLLFFGLGEFEFISHPDDLRVRVVASPGMTRYGGFALDFGVKSLEYCEAYYGIGYPLPKLDLIAVPDFAAGAMENWGAIAFRENLLLHFPEITSRAGEERICEVIAHEIAHQWFGNLVTPSEWKYLWLNESFATFFAYGVVDHYHPEWDMWDQFLEVQTDAALKRDALHETFPIEIPGGEHVVINVGTAPIIYNKGGSVLRQIRGYLGEESFRGGLGSYLNQNQYGSASSRHLWEALEEVSGEPVTDLMRSWIEQPGHPLLEARREGERLLLTQKRFTYLPNDSDQTWLTPATVRVFYEDGRSETKSTILKEKEGTIELGAGCKAFKVNDEQTGFYRVRYLSRADAEPLEKGVREKRLSSRDRWGLQNDLYALTTAGVADMEEYLAFLQNYENEDAPLPILSIAGNLYHAYLVFEGETRERVSGFGKPFLERVLSRIGFTPDPQEKASITVLRDQVLFQAVLYGSKEIEAFALDRFSSLLKGGTVHPDISRSVMQAGAWAGGEKAFDWLTGRLESAESEHERMNVLAALGCFSSPSLIGGAQRFVLDSVPNRNKFIPVSSMAHNPAALPQMWDWYVNHLDALEQFHPIHYERVITAIVPFAGIHRKKEVEDFFKRYLEKGEKAKDAVRLSLERLEIHSRMKERWKRQLEK